MVFSPPITVESRMEKKYGNRMGNFFVKESSKTAQLPLPQMDKNGEAIEIKLEAEKMDSVKENMQPIEQEAKAEPEKPMTFNCRPRRNVPRPESYTEEDPEPLPKKRKISKKQLEKMAEISKIPQWDPPAGSNHWEVEEIRSRKENGDMLVKWKGAGPFMTYEPESHLKGQKLEEKEVSQDLLDDAREAFEFMLNKMVRSIKSPHTETIRMRHKVFDVLFGGCRVVRGEKWGEYQDHHLVDTNQLFSLCTKHPERKLRRNNDRFAEEKTHIWRWIAQCYVKKAVDSVVLGENLYRAWQEEVEITLCKNTWEQPSDSFDPNKSFEL